MMRVLRKEEGAADPARPSGQTANSNSIADASAPPGEGGGTIPLLPAAIKVATALVKAAKGEDWRDAFRTKPDDYQLYQQAKNEESAGK